MKTSTLVYLDSCETLPIYLSNDTTEILNYWLFTMQCISHIRPLRSSHSCCTRTPKSWQFSGWWSGRTSHSWHSRRSRTCDQQQLWRLQIKKNVFPTSVNKFTVIQQSLLFYRSISPHFIIYPVLDRIPKLPPRGCTYEYWSRFFTGWIPLLLPNQQRPSTESILNLLW